MILLQPPRTNDSHQGIHQACGGPGSPSPAPHIQVQGPPPEPPAHLIQQGPLRAGRRSREMLPPLPRLLRDKDGPLSLPSLLCEGPTQTLGKLKAFKEGLLGKSMNVRKKGGQVRPPPSWPVDWRPPAASGRPCSPSAPNLELFLGGGAPPPTRPGSHPPRRGISATSCGSSHSDSAINFSPRAPGSILPGDAAPSPRPQAWHTPWQQLHPLS